MNSKAIFLKIVKLLEVLIHLPRFLQSITIEEKNAFLKNAFLIFHIESKNVANSFLVCMFSYWWGYTTEKNPCDRP